MDLTTKTETIQFGEKKVLGIFTRPIKFKVRADMPESLLDEYAEISNMNIDEKNPEHQKKAFGIMKQIIRGILYRDNNKKAVCKFVDELGMQGTNKVFVFLNEYINGSEGEKKNE